MDFAVVGFLSSHGSEILELPLSFSTRGPSFRCSGTSEILLATFGNHWRKGHFRTYYIFARISYGRRTLRRMLPPSLAVFIRQSKIAPESCLSTFRTPKENLGLFRVLYTESPSRYILHGHRFHVSKCRSNHIKISASSFHISERIAL
jgi:hypothetical protein